MEYNLSVVLQAACKKKKKSNTSSECVINEIILIKNKNFIVVQKAKDSQSFSILEKNSLAVANKR